jgi:site-specific DNA-methyltransferase (adenine-specific)
MPRKEVLAEGVEIWLGDCREILPNLPKVDAVVTDPPYSSGGAMRSDRNNATTTKYVLTGTLREYPEFSGDNRDQRSLMFWCSDWMAQCHRITRRGGAILCFIDWRNLPVIVDAIQVAGWVYRGIVPWDKGVATRPNKGWFRAQVEYVVTGSAGPLDVGADAPGFAQVGYIHVPIVAKEKEHVTGKPVELMKELLRTRDDWRVILDPFMGSGTTGVAAVQLRRKFVGIEIEQSYFDIARRRIEDALKRPELFSATPKPPKQEAMF